MAIRDQIRRALHKSDSSSNISESSNITTTTSANSDISSSSSSTSYKKNGDNSSSSSRLFPWRSSERDAQKKEKAEKKQQSKKKGKPIHPRDKPLTATNLRHQEMLSGFSMTFGASNPLARLENGWDYDDVSPCCTRPASIDMSRLVDEDYSTASGTATPSTTSKFNSMADFS